MKKLGDFKCPKCGWVHAGISETDAVVAVAEFNESFATMGLESRALFSDESQTLEIYQRCFRCGAPAATFLQAAPGDAPIGCTLQVVIAPNDGQERDVTSATDGGEG